MITDGATVVIGASHAGEDYQGKAYVYTYDGSTWSGPDTLIGDDEWSVYFGHSVSVDGDTVVIGDYYDDENGAGAGAAYIFVRDESGWDQGTRFTNNEPEAWDHFGISVSVAGNIVVVGAPIDDIGGSATVYSYSPVPHFRCDGFGPPLATNDPLRLRRTTSIPLRAQLYGENEQGNEVEIDGDVLAGVEPLVQITPIPLDSNESGEVSDIQLPASAADESIQFYFIETDEGYWQLILDARIYNTPNVLYEIKMIAHPDGEYLIDPTCTADFEYVPH